MIQTTLSAAALCCVLGSAAAAAQPSFIAVDDFDRADSMYHGEGWESLNPGYWKVSEGALRRRVRTRGDWGVKIEFPFRTLLHGQRPDAVPRKIDNERPPALPVGMIWRRDWRLEGDYSIRIETVIRALPEPTSDRGQEDEPGHSLMGIGFGAQSLFESWSSGTARSPRKTAAWMAAWRPDGRFGIYTHATDEPGAARPGSEKPAPRMRPGETATIELTVSGGEAGQANLTAALITESSRTEIHLEGVDRAQFTNGYFGLAGRGALDFEVGRVELAPIDNQPLQTPLNELQVCYPLGDTLKEVDGQWRCRFIALFRADGQRAEIRVADSPAPSEGWDAIPAAGSAKIINNAFRRNTASIEVRLPYNPAQKTMYYTVWKDGADVTGDPREGWLGQKNYVGRLPRLRAPYRLCGLGGHSINGAADVPGDQPFEANWVRGQPTPDAFRYIEEYDFQVLVWEDDVWYLELVLAPPSVDDAYKIIAITIANPTTRWQMMRHWNIINPGDHDYGMNDLRGPEQFAARHNSGLGQDPEYLRRNYQIVRHLISGDEDPSGVDNPKGWRQWKMPNRDFSLLILDARSWRDSTDTALYVNYGWGHDENIYPRDAPMRPLLGEEQFDWLSDIIRTDSSPLICLTGLNGLHTIWQGSDSFDPATGLNFNPRGRGGGDYAGWAKAGADRVIELLGSRDGIVTVYGDVHGSALMKNLKHRLYECSFGAIARNGSRGIKKGFGPRMNDYDLRPLDILGLYHGKYESPDLKPLEGAHHWNFLEMEFDPRGADPEFRMKIRKLIDPPTATPRGGGYIEDKASNTGRPHTAALPPIQTLPNADLLFLSEDGRPIRATRSLENGVAPISGLVGAGGRDIPPGARVLLIANDGTNIESQIIQTTPADPQALRQHRNNIAQLEQQAQAEYDGWVAEHQAKEESKP